MHFYLRQLSLILKLSLGLCLLLTGCSHYEFTLNERTLYDPLKFRRELQLADVDLQQCVKAVLEEQDITAAKQLTKLICGPGTIQSLEGLSIFSLLQQLGIANNQLADTKNLIGFQQMQQLNLENNRIVDASPLQNLPHLQWLNLRGNTSLRCETATALLQRPGIEVQLPKHCAP